LNSGTPTVAKSITIHNSDLRDTMSENSFSNHPVLGGRVSLELSRKADRLRNTLPDGLRETLTDIFVGAFLEGRDFEGTLTAPIRTRTTKP